MVTINGLIWDDWNREHLAKHKVSPEEVEEICHGKYQAFESFRGRIQVIGKTKSGKKLIIILSPEDRDLKIYGGGLYYPITAFEEV
ncbi:MAG TPA: hypothetical protein VNA13_04635 [Xanthomonadales bacterium]|nr:hypothetical protein [Xanthomonadales bacterium]